MTDEPKKLIEAHLEAHAAQRRLAAGEAFELDDAARLRLLTEVDRVHGLVVSAVPEAPPVEAAPVFQPLFPFQPQAVAEPLATVPVQEEIVSPVLPQTTAQELVQEVSQPTAAALPAEDEALRQALQAEIQRTESPKETVIAEEPTGPSAWTMLWTRLAFSFGTVALVGLAAFIVRLQIPTDRTTGALAKLESASEDKVTSKAGIALADATSGNEAASAKTNAASLAMAGASSTATPLIAANDSVAPVISPASPERELTRRQLSPAELREQVRSEKTLGRSAAPTIASAQTEPAPTPAPAPATTQPEPVNKPRLMETRALQVGVESAKAKEEQKSELPQPMPTAPARVASLPMAAGATPAVLREGSFIQRTAPSGIRRNLQSPRKPDVLTSFRVDLVADTVQLVDKDGSVYVGRRVGDEGSLRFTAAGVSKTLGRSVAIDASFVQPDAETTGGSILGRINLGPNRWWAFEAVSR